jgi:thiol-disulfide isomerase/thioredoxin/outer membrane lipoprotein-sorting protein
MRILSFIFPCLLLFTGSPHAQTHAQTILQKMADHLNRLQAVSYHIHTQINNSKDNYHGEISGDCFVAFNQHDIRRVARFRLQSDKATLIYNGHDLLTLNEKDSTYEIKNQPEDKDFSHLSLFYHSLPALRNMLPAIERNDSMTKIEGDTLIENKPYKIIRLSMHRQSLEYGDTHQPFTSDVTLFYTLVVDPASYLPCQIIQRNSIDIDGYVAITTFTAIDTRPATPAAWSWSTPAIEQKYHLPPMPAATPLIAAGMSLPDWALPACGEPTDTTIRSGQLRGKLLVLDFWIKNCGPCMESWPHLQALQKKYGGAPFQLLAINAEDSRKDVAFFFTREHPAYQILYNGKALAAQLGVPAYPTLVIVDNTGKVLYAGVGFDQEKIEGIIRNYLPLAGS